MQQCSETSGTKNYVDQLMTLCKNANYKEAAKHVRYPSLDEDDTGSCCEYFKT